MRQEVWEIWNEPEAHYSTVVSTLYYYPRESNCPWEGFHQ